eukprot:TRINITY_DN66218_c12_g1_i2.p1 TRINITY_DN66218_c12_g1~~TRINITY_DN66218_c12_g1_i2.p1  ORF type:complete len:374 (-),score=95.68 TRINITY_DN66218_c12_g1_i2:73-1194(-)
MNRCLWWICCTTELHDRVQHIESELAQASTRVRALQHAVKAAAKHAKFERLESKNREAEDVLGLDAGLVASYRRRLNGRTCVQFAQLNDAHVEAIAEVLKTHVTVTVKIVHFIGLSSMGVWVLFNAMTHNTSVTEIFIDNSTIDEDTGRLIGKVLETTLVALRVYNCGSTSELGQAIGQALEANTTLTWLNLENTPIGVQGGLAIGKALETNTTLTMLNLENSEICDEGARAIGRALRTNRTLVTLNLSSVDISADVAADVNDALWSNRSLTNVWMWKTPLVEQARCVSVRNQAYLLHRQRTALGVDGGGACPYSLEPLGAAHIAKKCRSGSSVVVAAVGDGTCTCEPVTALVGHPIFTVDVSKIIVEYLSRS